MQLIAMFQQANSSLTTRLKAALPSMTRRSAIVYALALLGAGFYLAPLHAGVMTSVKTIDAFARTLPVAPPPLQGFTTQPWFNAWDILSRSMFNSMLFTIPATFFSAVLGSLAAYGLTMVDWRGQVGLMALFVAAVFLPKQAILVPLSRFWAIVDLHGLLAHLGPINVWALPFVQDYYVEVLKLIFTHTAFGISICTLLFRGYYLTIDDELIEAARLDGASIYGIYRHIILPLSYPMFAVVFIFQFTQIWNEFLYGLVIVGGGKGAPVTVTLNELNSGYAQLYNRQTAGAFIAAIPTLLIYILFGEQFAKGVEY